MRKVLVVERDISNKELLVEIFECIGFIVEHAKDEDEAILKTKKGHYDLITMEVMVPKRAGFNACVNLMKEIKKIQKNVPVIALTACAMEGHKEKFLNAGFDGYIQKPMGDLKEFARTIRVYLKR